MIDKGNRHWESMHEVPTYLRQGSFPTHICVSVGYAMGGTNYFSGNRIARGYRVSLTPMELRDNCRVTKLMGDTATSGYYIQLADAPRYNARQLKTWADAIDPVTDAMAAHFMHAEHQDVRLVVAAIKDRMGVKS